MSIRSHLIHQTNSIDCFTQDWISVVSSLSTIPEEYNKAHAHEYFYINGELDTLVSRQITKVVEEHINVMAIRTLAEQSGSYKGTLGSEEYSILSCMVLKSDVIKIASDYYLAE